MRILPDVGVDFKISCPDEGVSGSPVQQIHARGNVALMLESDLVIELKRSEFLQNWQTTCALARNRIDHLVVDAGDRIFTALNDDELSDEPQLAIDTAAFYLLALRQKGVKYPLNMAPCLVGYYHDKSSVEVIVN
jgi:hypothetical protein